MKSLGTPEEQTEGMKRQAQDLIDQAYQKGFKAGCEYQKENYQDTQTELIEQGRNEAWEAARKIYLSQLHGGMSGNDLISIFGYPTNDILARTTASEAIEKLKEYEEQKKQEEDAEIRVGDEVILNDGEKAVVTEPRQSGFCVVRHDGRIGFKYKENVRKKTGRHFQEIAEVFKKMQEGAE